MKLHLPLSLRKSILAVCAVAAVCLGSVATAANMHGDATFVTYCDFGQNFGRYKTDASSNALLQYLRSREGGIVLTYTGGQADITLPQDMINFTGVSDNGAFMSLGYNATVSVEHNGVFSGGFTSLYIGGESKEVLYQGIEYRIDASETFIHSPFGGYDNVGNGGFDHKVTRMSKIITDVETATLFSGTSAEMHAYVPGQLVYHTGAGTMGVWSSDGNHTALTGAYDYIIGGVDKADACYEAGRDGVGDITLTNFATASSDSITAEEPLPFAAQQGDSGSPIFVYNDATEQYEYIGAVAYGGGSTTQTWGAVDYVRGVLESYDKKVELSAQTSVIHLGSVSQAGEAVSADNVAYNYGMEQTVSSTPYSGVVTDASGNVLQSFVGVKDGISTWKDLSSVMDSDNWYHYGDEFLNAAPYATSGKELNYADLFLTENLVFTARVGASSNEIILEDTVDLGIGYAQFSLDAGQSSAVFRISSGGDGTYQFNHAGYVIDAGVEVHTTLTGTADHVYEWRKAGAGDLYIEGSGNNTVLLNVGGRGSTYLNREGGYAAYNVLANTRSTVVIADCNQIARDFTFGHEGGTLDMNGNSMVWNNDNTDVAADGFTIHALDENAIVANMKSGSTTVMTWTQSGEQTFLGSFRDNGTDSRLQFVYDGGEGSTLTLNSVFTDLQVEGSGMIVNSGTLVLSGSNTVHGAGSASGTNAERYSNSLDWHYADAASDVTVRQGGVFELGSHARLTGDVAVEQGGVFIMHEGVQHSLEYIEGGQKLENTGDIAAFYGLKGDVSLADGAEMQVVFSAETTAENTYSGKISGAGALSVDAGTKGAALFLAGDNSDHTGSKKLLSGGLVATGKNSLGDTTENKWVVSKDGWIASRAESAETLLSRVDASSSGTLALSASQDAALDLSGHSNLFLGAEAGLTVHYGKAGTDEALSPVNGAWRLGGGGGTLQVNFKLTGTNDLLLGASGHSTGTVYLANSANDFSGAISFAGTGIILKAEAGALGASELNLSYGNAFELPYASALSNVSTSSEGMLMLDAVPDTELDLSLHSSLALGAAADTKYSGEITLAEDAVYRFTAAPGATLTLNSTLADGHRIVVDAQGLSGGRVVFAGNDSLANDITVMGHRDGSGGSIALGFGRDVTLSGSVVLQEGGLLDVNGQVVTLTGSMSGVGAVVDSISSGKLVMQVAEDTTFSTSLQLAQAEKTGAGMLYLTGTHDFDTFTVTEGSLKLAETASSVGSTVRLAEGTTLYTDGNVLSDISLANGAVISCNGNRIKGGIFVDASAAASYAPTTAYTAIDGNISVGENATFHLGTSDSTTGKLDLAGASIGSADTGRVVLNANISQVDLVSREDMHFAGTFEVTGDTMLSNNANADSKLREFDHLQINSTLKLQEVSWNTVWNIHQLSGSGKLQWNSWATHYSPSILRLDGESEFSGDIVLKRTAQFADRTHQAFIELSGQNAAQNATIVLSGRSDTSVASLAVNTENACIAGLQNFTEDDDGVTDSSVWSYVYAGSVPSSSASTEAPASNRSATLTFTGSGEYTYSGIVGNAADTTAQSLSLVMDGSGKQTLDGASVVVNNVTAQQGSLCIQPSGSLTVLGDVAIAQGATLKLGDTFALADGHKLSVLAVDGSSAQAVFDSQLQLAGGTLCFDGTMLSESTAALSLGGVALAEGNQTLTVEISNMSDFATIGVDASAGQSYVAKTYQLADGDWSALADDLSVTLKGDAADYLNTAIAMTADGLGLTLSLKEDVLIWRTLSASSGGGNTISSIFFGAQLDTVADKIALFTDVAEKKNVVVTANVTLQAMAVASSQDYSFKSSDGVISTPTLEHNGSGTTTINSGVTVTDSLSVEKGTLVVKNGEEFFASAAPTVELADKGTLCVDSSASLGELSMREGASLSSSVEGVEVTAASLSDFSGQSVGVERLTLQVTDGVALSEGARVLSDSTTLALRNGALLDDRSSYYAVKGTLTIGDVQSAAEGGTLYVKGLALVGKANDATLNVNAGSGLVITGSDRTSSNYATLDAKNYGDFQLTTNDATSGGSAPVINVDGTLTSGARFSVAGGEATINVNAGGTLNLLRGASVGGANAAIGVNVAGGGRVNISSYHYEDGNWDLTGDAQNNVSLNLSNGATVGGIGSSEEDIFLLQKVYVNGTASIDTDASAGGDDYTVSQTDAGGSLVLIRDISSAANAANAVLRVEGNGTAHFAGAVSLSGGLRVEQGAAAALSDGSIDVASRSTSLTQLASISSADGANAALVTGQVQMNHGENSVSIASASGASVVLQNSLVELQQSVSLELSDVTLAQDSCIAAAEAAVFAARSATSAPKVVLNQVTVQMAASAEPETALMAQTLTLDASGTGESVVILAGSTVVSVDSDQFRGVSLSSGSLTMEFTAEQTQYIQLQSADYLAVAFGEDTTIASGLSVQAAFGGVEGLTTGVVDSTNGVVYFGLQTIPEPTTVTLSLLALAALVGRRRRR